MIEALLVQLVLLRPKRVAQNLERVRAAGLLKPVPNLWQITLGVLRMWHRLIFRPDTIGTCRHHPVRNTWRARLLAYRPLRFPFLVWERAVAPFDLSGLVSPPDRVTRHLLAAHHDANQFVYDFGLLSLHPGRMEALREAARRVVEQDDLRSCWLRDLVVFERYHENLLAAVEATIEGRDAFTEEERNDPDITLTAYLAWCAAQPQTARATYAAWRAGAFTLAAKKEARA